MLYHHYTINIWNPLNNAWENENRYYYVFKSITDWDLDAIPNKRVGAKYHGLKKGPWEK